jgi:hypothetical protein
MDIVKCGSGPWVAKNQCWIGVSGAGPATLPALRPFAAAPPGAPGAPVVPAGTAAQSPAGPADSWTAAASPATVWWRKISSADSGSPARRARETTWMLRIESPPSSKKLSSTPTSSAPSTPAQIRARRRSVSVLAATRSPDPVSPHRGAGRALRSSLPFGFSGSSSSTT